MEKSSSQEKTKVCLEHSDAYSMFIMHDAQQWPLLRQEPHSKHKLFRSKASKLHCNKKKRAFLHSPFGIQVLELRCSSWSQGFFKTSFQVIKHPGSEPCKYAKTSTPTLSIFLHLSSLSLRNSSKYIVEIHFISGGKIILGQYAFLPWNDLPPTSRQVGN